MAVLIIVNSRDFSSDGDAWDGSSWVDVGDDGKWHPSVAERTRAFVLLGGLLGLLLLGAALASLGGNDETEVTPVSSTTTTTGVEITTTTRPLPSSLDGEPPPEQCRSDDRQAQALRNPSEIKVLVLNGARVGGLAGDTSDQLASLGYQARPDDAVATVASHVVYERGYCAEAVELADAVGVDDIEIREGELDDEVHLEILLGSDHFSD